MRFTKGLFPSILWVWTVIILDDANKDVWFLYEQKASACWLACVVRVWWRSCALDPAWLWRSEAQTHPRPSGNSVAPLIRWVFSPVLHARQSVHYFRANPTLCHFFSLLAVQSQENLPGKSVTTWVQQNKIFCLFRLKVGTIQTTEQTENERWRGTAEC